MRLSAHEDGRASPFALLHGETPAFMPVGTYGTVKGTTPESVKEIAEIILQHLHPGCAPAPM